MEVVGRAEPRLNFFFFLLEDLLFLFIAGGCCVGTSVPWRMWCLIKKELEVSQPSVANDNTNSSGHLI